MRYTKSTMLLTVAVLWMFANAARAQGSDGCADAQLISGEGPHTFTTSSATTDGHEEGVLVTPSLRQIENDVWFRWVAPKTAVYQVNTNHVPQTNGATAVAVYKFGCPSGPGRAIAGRMGAEVGGGIVAYPSFGAEAGVEYLVRIGNTVSLNRTNGIFTMEEMSPPAILTTAVNLDNERTYHMLEPSSWSVARVAALALGGDLVTVNDQAENDWLMETFWSYDGQNRSLWLGYNDAEEEGTWVWASGETPDYDNWSSVNGPNNGNQYEHYAHIRKDWVDGTWNDLLGFPGQSFFYDDVHGIVEIAEVVVVGGFNRGDSNADGGFNLADAVSLLSYLFVDEEAPTCLDAADANDDGKLNLADAVEMLGHLFSDVEELAPPFGACGDDLTDDPLTCASFPPCQ